MKHGLILGEPYGLNGRRYVAGLIGGSGDRVAAEEVLFEFDGGAPDAAEDSEAVELEAYHIGGGGVAYAIDVAGHLWEVAEAPPIGPAADTWSRLGLDLIPSPYTVADLVPLGLDPDVWGRL